MSDDVIAEGAVIHVAGGELILPVDRLERRHESQPRSKMLHDYPTNE